MAFLLADSGVHGRDIILGFGGIAAAQWLLFFLYLLMHRSAFEVETLAFFLCTMGMAAICSVVPGEAVKQLVSMVLGIVVGIVGLVMVALAYPLYIRTLKTEREKIAPEILQLSDDLLK